MRKYVFVLAVLSAIAMGITTAAAQNRASRSGSGQIVITFRDGHRQTFNLADVARIEFPGGNATADAGPVVPGAPPRGHFVGKWEVGDGSGNTFYITLDDNGTAFALSAPDSRQVVVCKWRSKGYVG